MKTVMTFLIAIVLSVYCIVLCGAVAEAEDGFYVIPVRTESNAITATEIYSAKSYGGIVTEDMVALGNSVCFLISEVLTGKPTYTNTLYGCIISEEEFFNNIWQLHARAPSGMTANCSAICLEW